MTASRLKSDSSRSSRGRFSTGGNHLPVKKDTTKPKDISTKEENTKKKENPVDDKPVESDKLDLSDNPDYIALSSALSLLEGQKLTAANDIRTLKELKKTALDDPEATLQQLQSSGTLEGVPRPQKVVKAPVIPWQKYGINAPGLKTQLDHGIVESSAPVGAVRLFEESYGDRQREKWNV